MRGPAAVNRALAVEDDDVRHARSEQDFRAGESRRAGAQHDHPDVLHEFADDLQRVHEGGERDDGRAMLVVVEDGDVDPLAEGILDHEAGGSGDVLQIDAAKYRRQAGDRLDDLVGVLRIKADRKRVDAGEFLEEHALALHHRHCRVRTDIAYPKHRGAIGHNRHNVAFDRQIPGFRGIGGDSQADAGDPGRVGHGEVVAGLEWDLAAHLDLAAEVQQERAIRYVDHGDAVDAIHSVHNPLRMRLIAGIDRQVANEHAGADAYDVHSADISALFPDRGGEAAQHARPVFERHP